MMELAIAFVVFVGLVASWIVVPNAPTHAPVAPAERPEVVDRAVATVRQFV